MTQLRIASAQEGDLGRYIDLLEEVAHWLEARGIKQWRSGSFRLSADYYAESIRQGEVHLAFVGHELIGTLRLLLREPIAWPEVIEDDAVHVYNLAVRRTWSEHRLGAQMLEWAADRATSLGRRYVRLDCMVDNQFLADYYVRAGFDERDEIDAPFPAPVGTLPLRHYERRLRILPTAAQHALHQAARQSDRVRPRLKPGVGQTAG
jgi:ribosomal protein S18 acetylase RimI-like enzyme